MGTIKARYPRAKYLPGYPTTPIKVTCKIPGAPSGEVIVPHLKEIRRDEWESIVQLAEGKTFDDIIIERVATDAMNWMRPSLRVTEVERETKLLNDRVKEKEKSKELTADQLARMNAILDEDDAKQKERLEEMCEDDLHYDAVDRAETQEEADKLLSNMKEAKSKKVKEKGEEILSQIAKVGKKSVA